MEALRRRDDLEEVGLVVAMAADSREDRGAVKLRKEITKFIKHALPTRDNALCFQDANLFELCPL